MTSVHPAPEPSPRAAEPPWRERAPWGIRDVVTVLGLTIISLVFIYASAGILLSRLGVRGNAARALAAGLVATFVFDMLIFALARGLTIVRYRVRWSDFGFRGFPASESYLPIVGIGGTFLLLAVYLGLVSVLHLDALRPSPNLPEGIFKTRSLIAPTAIEACLMAPFVEEAFFRGFIFRGLLGRDLVFGPRRNSVRVRIGFWVAALISGLLFAAFHGQIGLLMPFTAVGVLFAWIFWRSGSLWAGIMAHAGFNSITFAVALLTRQ